jgi:hypothetical protein
MAICSFLCRATTSLAPLVVAVFLADVEEVPLFVTCLVVASVLLVPGAWCLVRAACTKCSLQVVTQVDTEDSPQRAL